jgi:segregation and condensation protein B
MTLEDTMLQIEALVFASDKAITPIEIHAIITELFPDEENTSIESVVEVLNSIQEKYNQEQFAFTLKEIGGGWQFLTKKEYHNTISKLNGDKFLKKLSTAALETLAIIAYKQPITKPDVEYIRGVNCDYSVQKLLEKELIVISGRNEEAVGKPLLYSTSKSFMDYLGINSMDDLPRLKEVVGEDIVIPTDASEAAPQNDETVMVVSADGNLEEVKTEENTADNTAMNSEEGATTDATESNEANDTASEEGENNSNENPEETPEA